MILTHHFVSAFSSTLFYAQHLSELSSRRLVILNHVATFSLNPPGKYWDNKLKYATQFLINHRVIIFNTLYTTQQIQCLYITEHRGTFVHQTRLFHSFIYKNFVRGSEYSTPLTTTINEDSPKPLPPTTNLQILGPSDSSRC
jgi:hypothetical protein